MSADKEANDKKRDDDSDCVSFALRHGEKLDERTLARLLTAIEAVRAEGKTTPPNDARFHFF